MNNSQPKQYEPADLVMFIDSEVTAGPTTIFNISLLGKTASEIFGQANEALYRQYNGWEKVYDEAAEEFEKIAGFRPEELYDAMAKLRESKGLSPWVDRQRKPLVEGLNRIRFKTKEG